MKKNMGSADKILRLIIAVIVAALFFSGVITGLLGTILLVLSVIFVLTSLVSFCPIYTLLGINTCKIDK